MRGRRTPAQQDGRRRPWPADPAVLSLVLVLTLAAGSILGGVFVLGRALGPSDPAADRLDAWSSASPTAGPSREPAPGASPTPSTAPTSATPSAPEPEAVLADERPRLALERGGPYGSRHTSGSREVALTFDDGPDPTYTPRVLALLERYQVKATFCLVGEQAAAHPDLVRAIAAAGHTLCNHSWSHDLTLGSRPRTTIRTDLTRTNAAIRAAVPGARIVYFRQPGGAWTSTVVGMAWELGMTSLHWDVDPQDWDRPGTGNIASTVTAGTRAGSIVLMHDAGGDRQQTVNALETILPNLLRRFELASLPSGPPRAETDNTGHTDPG
ncbi:polysaccharide deacetylase family protein [Micromonospora sp. NPDC050397]|uniref:polysaccharide deacetylase family protein n=1 Tax=Micromonospora sp. NPDC050397 TaxID=3364279 RepID=UPI00384ED826